MQLHLKSRFFAARDRLRRLLRGPRALAFLPMIVLAAFWLGGEGMLMAIALGMPICLLIVDATSAPPVREGPEAGDIIEGSGRDGLETALENQRATGRARSLKTACLILEIDDFRSIRNLHGSAAADLIMTRCCDRLSNVLRGHDLVFPLVDGQMAIATAPVRQLNHDICLQLATRFQAAVEQPVPLDAGTVYVSVSVGFCTSVQRDRDGADIADGAFLALNEARRHGPSAIRAYSANLKPHLPCAHAIADEIETALREGEFIPWFQPQISTDTGRVTGMEALARWSHPKRGLIAPAEFLPVIERSNQSGQLSDVILHGALTALRTWDKKGADVPRVGVNFSPEELRNPKLPEQISRALDRFDIPPQRLSVEILETVVATSPEDTIARNVSGLAELGCHIDLDDFGTGHASISSIRRFAITRLKVDRSFVMKVDQDPDQQRMVAAILLMAEQLGLDTLAEGVETAGEHSVLAQLGCRHIQGFGIARPMPFEMTLDWIKSHHGKLKAPPIIGRNPK